MSVGELITRNALPDLKSILDSLPQGILIVKSDFSIVLANFRAEQMFQTSEAQLVRDGLKKFLPAGHPLLQLLEQVFDAAKPVNEYRVKLSLPWLREERMLDIYASPILEASGFAILSMRDRGVADRIDRQLDHRSAARSVTGLAAMLGHEIKNPLSGIRGAAQLLGSNVRREDKPLAELITAETDRIVKILDRMEVFSNEIPLSPEPVNVHSVLDHVKRIAENGFAENIEISENYDPSLPDVSGSRDELIQVFLNLIKNAAEAVSGVTGAKIILSSAYRPGMRFSASDNGPGRYLPLEFSVSDNGPGISQDLIEHIFEPFVTSKLNGSGLGLAMVARIIERHGGMIECESEAGATSFRILLPALGAESNPSSAPEDES